MNIEEIIRAWKAEKADEVNQNLPANPVGNELSDKEIEEVVGEQGAQEWNAMPNTTYGEKECHTKHLKSTKYQRTQKHCL